MTATNHKKLTFKGQNVSFLFAFISVFPQSRNR